MINSIVTKSEREKEQYKRNAWNTISTMVGLGITGASGYYAFKGQNPNLSGKIPGVSNLTNFINNPAQEKIHPMNTIGKQIRKSALDQAEIKKSLEIERQSKQVGLFGIENASAIDAFNQILQGRDNDRIAHLSTLMDMINDPGLSIAEHDRNRLIESIRNAIQVDANSNISVTQEVENLVQTISQDKNLESRYLDLHQKNKSIAGLVATQNRNGSLSLPNPFDSFREISTRTSTVNKRNVNLSDLSNNQLYQNYKGRENQTKNTVINRANKIIDHLKKGNNASSLESKFNITFDVIDEGGTSGFYAKIQSRKSGASSSPIIIPLLGADTENGKVVRLSADFGNAKLAHKNYYDVKDFQEIFNIQDPVARRNKAKETIKGLAASSSFEDFAINLFEMHSHQQLFEMNQAERNVFMETLTGLTMDITPNARLNLGHSGTQAKHGMQMIANTAYFFHTKGSASEAFPLDLNKLVGLDIGVQGPAQGQAGIKRLKIAGKNIEQRMAIVAPNAGDLTPVSLVRAIGGVKDQAILPGSARPAQQFAKPEALLGYMGPDMTKFNSAQELNDYLNSRKIGRGNIPMFASRGGQLMNVDPAFKDLPMIGANTSIIINFNQKAKKGQLFGLADAMQYSGGSLIVESPIKKSFQVLSNMPNLSIYQSEQFKRLNEGGVVELFGDELEEFYKTYGDKEGNLVLGFNNNEPIKITKQKGMLGLRLQKSNVAMNEKEGRYYLTGSIISREHDKVFSEPVKGMFYGEEALLKEEGFTRVLGQAMGDVRKGENFIQNVAKKGFNINFETSMVAGMDVVTKAPLFIASLMRGSVLHLGYDADEFDQYIAKSFQNAGIEPATLDTKVGEHTKKYFRQFGTAVFDFLQTKMNQALPGTGEAGTLTPELIGTVMVPTQALDEYGTEQGGAKIPLFQELLAKSTLNPVEQAQALDTAKTGMFVGAFSAYAGTQSSINQSKLARVEPRFANFLATNLMSNFGMTSEEAANVMSDLFNRQVGIGEKIMGISPLLLSSYSMNPNQSAEAMNMLIDDYVSEGKLYKADKNLVQQFLDVNVNQESADSLADYIRKLKAKTGDAMGMVIDIKDLFVRGVEGFESINTAAYESFLEEIGTDKTQIILPLSDALDSISGVELRKEGEDLKMESSLYRRINDIFSNIREASVSQVDTEQKRLIGKSIYYIRELQELTGSLNRQILSGRITGSATLKGIGIRLGGESKGDITSILSNDFLTNKKTIEKMNKAMVASQGYAQFMDIQGFLYAYKQLQEPEGEGYERFDTLKRFLFGMEEGQYIKDASGNIVYDEKAFAPKGVSGTSFRNPQLGFAHISFGIDLYRSDTDNLAKSASLNNVIEHSKYGQQLQESLRKFIGSGSAFTGAVDNTISNYLMGEANNPNSNFLNFSNLNKMFQLAKLGGFANTMIQVGESLQDRIAKKQGHISNLDNIIDNLRFGRRYDESGNLVSDIQSKVQSAKKQFNFLNQQLNKQAKLNVNLQLKQERLKRKKEEKRNLKKDKYLPKHQETIENIDKINRSPDYHIEGYKSQIESAEKRRRRAENFQKIKYDPVSKKYTVREGATYNQVDKLTYEHFSKNLVQYENVKYYSSMDLQQDEIISFAYKAIEDLKRKERIIEKTLDNNRFLPRVGFHSIYEHVGELPSLVVDETGAVKEGKTMHRYRPIPELRILWEKLLGFELEDELIRKEGDPMTKASDIVDFRNQENVDEYEIKYNRIRQDELRKDSISSKNVMDVLAERRQKQFDALDKIRSRIVQSHSLFFNIQYYQNPKTSLSEKEKVLENIIDDNLLYSLADEKNSGIINKRELVDLNLPQIIEEESDKARKEVNYKINDMMKDIYHDLKNVNDRKELLKQKRKEVLKVSDDYLVNYLRSIIDFNEEEKSLYKFKKVRKQKQKKLNSLISRISEVFPDTMLFGSMRRLNLSEAERTEGKISKSFSITRKGEKKEVKVSINERLHKFSPYKEYKTNQRIFRLPRNEEGKKVIKKGSKQVNLLPLNAKPIRKLKKADKEKINNYNAKKKHELRLYEFIYGDKNRKDMTDEEIKKLKVFKKFSRVVRGQMKMRFDNLLPSLIDSDIEVFKELQDFYTRVKDPNGGVKMTKSGLPDLRATGLSPRALELYKEDRAADEAHIEKIKQDRISKFRFKQYKRDDQGNKIPAGFKVDKQGKQVLDASGNPIQLYELEELPETKEDAPYKDTKEIKKRLNEVREERLKKAKERKTESIAKTEESIKVQKDRINEQNAKVNELNARILSESQLDVTPADGSEAYKVNSARMVLGVEPAMVETEVPLTYYDQTTKTNVPVLDKDKKQINYKVNQYALDDLDSINSIDDLNDDSALKQHLEGKINKYRGYQAEQQTQIDNLQMQAQKAVNSGLNPEQTKSFAIHDLLDEILGVYKDTHGAAVGLGSGALLIPEFETEVVFQSNKPGSQFNDYKVKVRTDLSRAAVGDFDGDIYQVILNNEKSALAYRQQVSKNVKEMQKTGALFVINMEIAKDAMKQVAKRLNVSDLSYAHLLESETAKERILKGSVGSVDVAVKTAAVGAAYSIMESGQDINMMRKTDLAAQTLISAAQESIVIKSKSLPLATNIGEQFTESINYAFKTGDTSRFSDFLRESIFKDTMFLEELVAKSAKVSNLPEELATVYESNLMDNGGLRFSLDDIIEGFNNIVTQVRKRGLNTYASDNILANLLSSTKGNALTSEQYMRMVRNTSVLESVVANPGFSSEEQQQIFENLMGAKRASAMSMIAEDLSRVSNLRFSAATAAVLGASYFLSSSTDTEELKPEEIFTDSRVSEKIRNRQLVPENRDINIPAESLQRPFYKDMVNRVITPGQTPMLRQQSYLIQGNASSEYEANYISNMVLQTGGQSSMMMNDNRSPITGGYIDRLMGE